MNGAPLTRREQQILSLLMDGHNGESIANHLGTTVETVKSQCSSLYRKRGVSSRLELVTTEWRRRVAVMEYKLGFYEEAGSLKMTTTPEYLLDYVPILKQWEGNVLWMYLDTEGNVTTGVGFMIPTMVEACYYDFYTPVGTLATPSQIAGDWMRVKRLESGRLPDYYVSAEGLTLKQADIDTRLLVILSETDSNLTRDFVGFESWPNNAKMAAVDMDYNLGDAKLRGTYPRFDAAADRQDFAAMGVECNREGISQARNEWTKSMFLSCAAIA